MHPDQVTEQHKTEIIICLKMMATSIFIWPKSIICYYLPILMIMVLPNRKRESQWLEENMNVERNQVSEERQRQRENESGREKQEIEDGYVNK